MSLFQKVAKTGLGGPASPEGGLPRLEGGRLLLWERIGYWPLGDALRHAGCVRTSPVRTSIVPLTPPGVPRS